MTKREKRKGKTASEHENKDTTESKCRKMQSKPMETTPKRQSRAGWGGGGLGLAEAMYLALFWSAMASPPHSHFPRARGVTASFLDRAMSSPGTRTVCTASHTAFVARTIINIRSKKKRSLSLRNRTDWHVLSWWSPGKGRHCIFRRRQNRHANLARNTGRLRPNRGKVKADSSPPLLSREDAAGAPVEDDGRDDSGESGLNATDWSSLEDAGSAG